MSNRPNLNFYKSPHQSTRGHLKNRVSQEWKVTNNNMDQIPNGVKPCPSRKKEIPNSENPVHRNQNHALVGKRNTKF